jgi:rSAM/selenodomain-associated transferase 2
MCGFFICVNCSEVQQKISIIIPVCNEADHIGPLLHYLKQHGGNNIAEIIVSDGGSTDDTATIAAKAGAMLLPAPVKGRAAQMNYGTTMATGIIYYFIHADTQPPESFATDIIRAVNEGYACGRYRTKFNSSKWLLKLNAFFTRFNWFVCYGGDQTFFITKELFVSLNGYNPAMQIMEEYDLTARAQRQARYKIFPKAALVSARKYEGRSWWQVQMTNRKAVQLFRKGASQQQIAETYRAMLDN